MMNEIKNNQRLALLWKGGLAVALLSILGVGTVAVAGSSGFWHEVAVITGGLLAEKVESPSTDAAFGATTAAPKSGGSHFTTTGLKNRSTAAGYENWSWEEWMAGGPIDASTSTPCQVEQTEPGEVYVDLANTGYRFQGTTSATTFAYMGTSTSAIAPDYNATVAALPRGILNGRQSVTGTVQDVIDALFEARSTSATLNSSSTLIRVPKGQFVICYLTTGGSNILQGNSVTSTAGRGWTENSSWQIHFRKFTTSTQQ